MVWNFGNRSGCIFICMSMALAAYHLTASPVEWSLGDTQAEGYRATRLQFVACLRRMELKCWNFSVAAKCR